MRPVSAVLTRPMLLEPIEPERSTTIARLSPHLAFSGGFVVEAGWLVGVASSDGVAVIVLPLPLPVATARRRTAAPLPGPATSADCASSVADSARAAVSAATTRNS